MYIPNIDRASLLERLKFSMKKEEVVRLANSFFEIGISPEEVIEYTKNSNAATAFHSAWVLENMLLSLPEALDYYLPYIVEAIPVTDNESVRRHLTKLAAIGIKRIVKKEASRVFDKEFWSINLEPLEEVCFKWFVSEDSKPAVKAHCLEILYLLSTRQKWIAEELPQIIENQMHFGSPGLKAKGKAILKLLRQA
jgi:hypothetical protein